VPLGAKRTSELLLDREPELAELDHALGAARGGDGCLVLIEAGAGLGKSALLRGARPGAARAGSEVLQARGSELEREHPFGLVRQLLEPLLHRLDTGTRTELFAGAAAPAAALLEPARDAELAAAPAGFGAVHAIFWLIANLAARRPLVVVVDDLHWGDTSSLRALDHLARRIGDLPVALVTAFRPDEPGAPLALLDELRRAPEAQHLRPRPLNPAAVATVVRMVLPEADEAVCRACAGVTAGNPLLLAELLRALRAGTEPRSAACVDSAAVPSLAERVLRRAEGVAPEAPALCRAMAVLGDDGRVSTAAALAQVDPARAADLAHRLRQIEVLNAEDPFSFVHPLVRSSVYDAVPGIERSRLHERAAELLAAEGAPADAVAVHLGRLPPSGSSRVAAAQVRAAEDAVRRGAIDEAMRWLERALAEGAPSPPRAELQARLGLALATARDPQAVLVLQAAFDELTDPGLRREVAVELGYSLAVGGAWAHAAAHLERACRELAGDAEAISHLAAMRASLELHDPRRAIDFETRRCEYERVAAGPGPATAPLRVILANEAAYRGRIAAAREWVDLGRGKELVSEIGAGSWALPMLLGLPIMLDELAVAEELILETDRQARASGAALSMLSAVGFGGWLRARHGDLAGAEVDLSTALELVQQAGLAMGVANVALFVVDVLLERPGAAAPAAAAIEQTTLPPDFQETYSGAMLVEARGRLRLARGERTVGIADLRAAGRTMEGLGFGPVATRWRSELALALGPAERDQALRLAARELELARATGLPRLEGIALRAQAALELRGQAPVDRLRESVALLERSPARLESARSRVALGAALRRANRRQEARAELAAGLDLAVSCGAHRLRAQAEEELLAAGGRRRPGGRADAEALTASEQRVARLAGRGLSNAEIAQTLYVSLKTVETHLSRSYAKLGLAGAGSRQRMAELLAADGATNPG
jgi:DNA-binding CsgD family transcriptional regulator